MITETPDSSLSRFGASIYDSLVVNAPFGSLSKSELDLAVFTALVESGMLDPDDRPLYIARQLRCTPTRVRALVFNYRLRSTSAEQTTQDLVNAIRVVKDAEAKQHKRVILNVEQQFWRETLIDELKKEGVFTDGSFNRERLTLDAKDFVSACEKIFGQEGKRIAKAVKTAKRSEPAEVLQDLVAKAAAGGAKAAGSAVAGPTIAMIAGLIT